MTALQTPPFIKQLRQVLRTAKLLLITRLIYCSPFARCYHKQQITESIFLIPKEMAIPFSILFLLFLMDVAKVSKTRNGSLSLPSPPISTTALAQERRQLPIVQE